MTLTFLSSCS